MLRKYLFAGVLFALGLPVSQAQTQAPHSEAAAKFGQREGIRQISLSPDGTKVAIVASHGTRGARLEIARVDGSAPVHSILNGDGQPERLTACHWVSNSRLVCTVYMVIETDGAPTVFTRLLAINDDGRHIQRVSAPQSSRALGYALGGGQIIDWLVGDDNAVLMARHFIPDEDTGTRIAARHKGMGVERLDTVTLKRTIVERPYDGPVEYISDAYGQVRIRGEMPHNPGEYLNSKKVIYSYRLDGQRDWRPLSVTGMETDQEFDPVAVDRTLNAVYGFQKVNGRQALYRMALDGSRKRELIHAHPDVDIDGLVQIGRQRRVVGFTYATDKRVTEFFDPSLKALAASLSKALPGLPLITFIDSSLDESKLLLWSGSDDDPGRYYIFDKAAKKLNEVLLSRPELEHTKLAKVTAITYPGADGVRIPAYLTLPVGSSGKNLPAIVMPHGGPGARDEWGFDWLSQFFAARGYAVLQPNFRGSTGYGDAWYAENGFKSWRVAIGDVNDAGRWLNKEGIAAPGKLGIFGWSYGGYAALQTSVLDPDLFKAIVAVAPVTDLEMWREESARYNNYRLVRDFIGSGPHLREGSPARNADRIKAPVLMFHGKLDRNVNSYESQFMADKLKAAGRKAELVLYPGLDHYLEDSAVRTEMLDKSDKFLRGAMGLPN